MVLRKKSFENTEGKGENLGWHYRSPKSPLAIKNCSWHLKTPKEQILAIKRFVINKKSPTMNFILSSVTLHFHHCKLTVYKPYRHVTQAIFIFDIQVTHVLAAHLTRLSSCIINGYGYRSILFR